VTIGRRVALQQGGCRLQASPDGDLRPLGLAAGEDGQAADRSPVLKALLPLEEEDALQDGMRIESGGHAD
jgi:hypothetical protein